LDRFYPLFGKSCLLGRRNSSFLASFIDTFNDFSSFDLSQKSSPSRKT